MTLEKIHEITSALKRGAEVKIKFKDKEHPRFFLTSESLNNEYCIQSVVTFPDKDLIIDIIEPKEPRLPTYEEVFKWFEEGKVFQHKSTKEFCKIEIIGSKDDVILIKILATNFSIQQFVTYLTDKNGNSLMIID